MSDLLSYEDALRIVIDTCTPLPREQCALADCLGHVLAQPLSSPADLPPFDNSAMDGFALTGDSEAVAAGTELDVHGEQAAGDGVTRGGESACEIMTGARVPDGFDRVIAVERTQTLTTREDGRSLRIRLTEAVETGSHLRRRGSDIARGDAVLGAGTVVEPRHLMLLAALGICTLPVVAKARAAVLSTGRELVTDPQQELAPGQIRNSNGPFLAARLRAAGAEVVHEETVGDDVDAYIAALQRALEAGARVILSTGAVSMGRYDFVPKALEQLGARTLFHKVAIRPGKPLLLARLPDDALLFGLPGNPAAGAVGLRFFVEPALRSMAGMTAEPPLRVPLAEAFEKSVPLRFHLKAVLSADARGQLSVRVLGGQQSYRIGPLAAANCWAVVPADGHALDAGTLVDVYGLGHLESPSLGEITE